MKKFCLLLLFLSVLSFSSVAASISGYYRIKNVAGSSGKCYVSVTGPYYGAPQETAVTKDTLAGTVVYISAEETSTSGTYKITSLRSQGVEILNVINAVKSRLQNMSEADFNTLWAKVEAKAASYSSKLAKFGINMDDFKYADFQSYVNNDIDYNLYLVSTGSNYYAIWNSPNVPAYFKNKSYTVLFFKIYFQDAVNALWSSVSSSLKTMVDARLTGDKAALIPIADNFIDNFQFGTKMYLTENTTTAIFNFANSSPSDNGKWTLEPVDATNYFAAAPKQYTVGTDNYYFTTLYTDFAYTLPSTVKAYKIPSATKIVRQGTNTCTYYVANGVEITGTVPIHTPVLLRCTSTAAADNILQPVVTGASPAPKKVTTATSDNLLVSTFFNETTTATSYLSLRYAAEDDPANGTTFGGVGFWKAAVQSLLGNKCYLDASKITGDAAGADGYVLELGDGVVTGVEDNVAAKVVAGVVYYNQTGIASDVPFEGVNIVVTTYTDGSRATAKRIIRR